MSAVARLIKRTLASSTNALPGTAPFHHAYVLLHSSVTITAFPAKPSSPLQRALQLNLLRSGSGGSVNFSWSPHDTIHPNTKVILDGLRDPDEQYAFTAFTRGQALAGTLSHRTLDRVARALTHTTPESVPHHDEQESIVTSPLDARTTWLYVCTHGSRDCRCADTGGAVFRALQARLAAAPTSIQQSVRLAEVAHVGGHKYAANVLVYPSGDWLGNVTEADVPRVLDEILERREADERPLCITHWRGRMGLDKEQQIALYQKYGNT